MPIFDVAGRLLACALAGVAALLAAATLWVEPAAAQGAIRSVHGDWQVRCEAPPGAQNEQCALMQVVQSEDRPNMGLSIIVLRPAGTNIHLLRVLAPPGVLLPSGLGLKIDDNDMGHTGYVKCLPNGCLAEVTMDEKLISALRNGHVATFIIFMTPEVGTGFPVSLNGFGPGYDALP
jgi:invasion protein IalB